MEIDLSCADNAEINTNNNKKYFILNCLLSQIQSTKIEFYPTTAYWIDQFLIKKPKNKLAQS